jgi:hypothetical protein
MGPNAGSIYNGQFGTAVDQTTLIGLQGIKDKTGSLGNVSGSDTSNISDLDGRRGTSGVPVLFIFLFVGAVVSIGIVARKLWLAWKSKDANK